MHGFSRSWLKWSFLGGRLSWRSVAATSPAAGGRRFFLFFLSSRLDEGLSRSRRFSCAARWSRSKTAPTASSPEAWLEVISRTSCVVRGFLHPSLWTRVLQCVPLRNAPMTSASTTPGSELYYLEKRRM